MDKSQQEIIEESLLFDDSGMDYSGPLADILEREGQKFDDDKPRMDLLPLDALEEVAKVLTHGARKYAPDNWKQVSCAEARYTAALLRHLTARQTGERLDAESGLSHAAHVATNALFILWFELQKEKNNVV